METQTFVPSTRQYLSMATNLFDTAWLSFKERGPVRVVYKKGADWYLFDDIAYQEMLAGTLASEGWGLDV